MKKLECCPVCESRNVHHDFTGVCERRDDGSEWPIYRCDDCSHGFMNPQPTWDELQTYYDAAYDPYESEHALDGFDETVAEARRKGEFRHIEIRPGLRILDVGCGGGAFLRVARELGAIVQGVEPSPHGVRTAKKAGLPVFHGEIEDFAEAVGSDTKFDVITANHVVEHHPDPAAMVRTMASLLSDDGYLWFAVPNAGSWSARVLKEKWHSVDLPYHLMQFNEASMRETLKRAGLRTQRLYTYSLPAALEESIAVYLRFKAFVPRRFSKGSSILKALAKRKGKRMDAAGDGEALIVEARAT
jgi:2-polyprenyl-3-methyl-5-hydroxy-6-metoxy-1,4-benzoquinol methylase